MRKNLVSFFLFAFLSPGFAQVAFENGYFIKNDSSRTDCFINNFDWFNNPLEFTYKLSLAGSPSQIRMEEVKEFGVSNHRYIRANVQLDRSSNDARKLGMDKGPRWSSEQLFLRLIIDGKAKLYVYQDKDVLKFFFSVENSPIEQLVHKLYLVTATEIATNNAFWNQLNNQIACGDVSTDRIKKVKYEQQSLSNYFTAYNNCSGGGVISKTSNNNESPRLFHVRMAPGIDFPTLKLSNSVTNSETELDQESSVRIGVEAEWVLPFNKNKWSLFVEPTYQTYNTAGTIPATYSSLEIPFGVRHYFFLRPESKIFINAAGVLDFPFKYEVKWSNNRTLVGKGFSPCLSGGLGYTYKKLSFEGRYYMNRSLLDEAGGFFLVYRKFSFILGYRLF